MKPLYIISSVSILFLLLIMLNVSPLLRGPAPYPPEWQWPYYFVNTFNKVWLPLAIGGIILFVQRYFESQKNLSKKQEIFILTFFLILAFLLQLAILYFSRSGVFVLLHRMINPDINSYFVASLRISHVNTFLATFNSILPHLPTHARDHPPGGEILFWILNQTSSYFKQVFPFVAKIQPKGEDVEKLWYAMSSGQRISAIISPFIISIFSFSALFPLYFSVKRLYGIKAASRSASLFIVIPSMMLFIPLIDILLPVFTLWSFYFYVKPENNNVWYIYLSGLFISIGLIISFSILPVILFICLLLVITFIQKGKKNFMRYLQSGICFMLGVITLPVILFISYHYNILETALVTWKIIAPRSYLIWLGYNLYDFFMFTGIPVSCLFIFAFKKQASRIFHINIRSVDPILLSFLGMIVILDISGFCRAETGRIWIPFMPLLIITSVYYATKYLKLSTNAWLVILLLQIIQIIIFQEFLVTVW